MTYYFKCLECDYKKDTTPIKAKDALTNSQQKHHNKKMILKVK